MQTKRAVPSLGIAFLWAMTSVFSYGESINQQPGAVVETLLKADSSAIQEEVISSVTPVAWQESSVAPAQVKSPSVVKKLETLVVKSPQMVKRPSVRLEAEKLAAKLASMPVQPIAGFVIHSEMGAWGKIFLCFLGMNVFMSLLSRKSRKKIIYPKHYCFHATPTPTTMTMDVKKISAVA